MNRDHKGIGWQQEFNKFWLSQAVVQIVTQAAVVTIPLLAITYLDTPSNQIGLLTAIQYVPVLLVTPLLGAYVDALRRRPIMLVAHTLRALIYGAGAVLSAQGLLTTTGLLAFVVVGGVFTAAFDVALQTFVPNTVPRDGLVAANSRIQGSLSFAQVLGPALGAGLIAIGAPWPTLLIFSLGFALAAGLLLRNKSVETVATSSTTDRFWARLTQGTRLAWRSPVLRTLLLSSTWFNLMEQAMMATFFVFAVRVAGLSSSTVAMALGAGAAGSVLGAVLANRVSSKGDPRHRLVVYAGLAAVAPVALNLLPQAGGSAVALAIGIFALYGIGLTSYNVEAISLRQRNLPDGAQGKTGAAYRLFAYGALAAGGLLSALLVTLFGVSAALVFATVTLVVGWVALVPIYLRGLTAAA